jgi:hypothetical protein
MALPRGVLALTVVVLLAAHEAHAQHHKKHGGPMMDMEDTADGPMDALAAWVQQFADYPPAVQVRPLVSPVGPLRCRHTLYDTL